MSSCEGAGTFWAGKKKTLMLQFRDFCNRGCSRRYRLAPPGPPLVPVAIKSLGEGCGLKVIHVPLQGNGSTQRPAEEQRE